MSAFSSTVARALRNRPASTFSRRAAPGTVYLTTDPKTAPAALLHNLKHNQVVHEEVILLTLEFLACPRVADADRATVEALGPGFRALRLATGSWSRPT